MRSRRDEAELVCSSASLLSAEPKFRQWVRCSASPLEPSTTNRCCFSIIQKGYEQRQRTLLETYLKLPAFKCPQNVLLLLLLRAALTTKNWGKPLKILRQDVGHHSWEAWQKLGQTSEKTRFPSLKRTLSEMLSQNFLTFAQIVSQMFPIFARSFSQIPPTDKTKESMLVYRKI